MEMTVHVHVYYSYIFRPLVNGKCNKNIALTNGISAYAQMDDTFSSFPPSASHSLEIHKNEITFKLSNIKSNYNYVRNIIKMVLIHIRSIIKTY